MSPPFRPALGLFFLGAGAAHLLRPAPFVAIMPAWVPDPEAATLLSGLAEMMGGVGLLVPATRRAASWGLLALLLAVFPANLNMALHAQRFSFPPWLLWARLPMQPLLMLWVWRAARPTHLPARGARPRWRRGFPGW